MEAFKFPTGEAHCRVEKSTIVSVPPLGNVNDYLMMVMMACDAQRRVNEGEPFSLIMPYMPYSRQDRPTSDREPFSLAVVGHMLNSTGASKIYTLDVHSDVAFGCIKNLVNVPQKILVESRLAAVGDLTLVIPDQGAVKKAATFSQHFPNAVQAIKHRDIKTGALSIEAVIGQVQGKDCLIVDDICDGGGTFIMLAQKLKELGANRIKLMVTHGIFTKGTRPIFESGIDTIYTTDSFEQHKTADGILHVTSTAHLMNIFLERNQK